MNTLKTIGALLLISTICCFGCKPKTAQNVVSSTSKTETPSPTPSSASKAPKATVYLTRDITPEALVNIYNALGRKAEGRVAVKISTGEAGNNNYLKPALIKNLVETVNGTIVECNTAYGGQRSSFKDHWQTIKDHGFSPMFKVDLMDEEGEFEIPVQDDSNIKCDIVGTHLKNYDFMINLAHFKGHPMGGMGGVIKNASIGVASANGKAYIHTAGYQRTVPGLWQHTSNQDGFLESMAAAAQAVHNYFDGGKKILYIAVMNNMSVDCDCVSHPEAVKIKDYGILASLDPVALDKACVDIIFNMTPSEGNDNAPLKKRISSRHGIHTIEHAAKIGLGSMEYDIVNID
ncbi:MAG: DUF362 domain-containing protein [Bacteroidales bacterium]|nr:DUF362 domain-containing protein [Bacteroidales bacterium]